MNSVTVIRWIQVLFLIQWMAYSVISQNNYDSLGNTTSRNSSSNNSSSDNSQRNFVGNSSTGNSTSSNTSSGNSSSSNNNSSSQNNSSYGNSSNSNSRNSTNNSTSNNTSYGNSPANSSSTQCNADSKEPWSYREGNGLTGPSSWGSKFGPCNGHIQSPIAVNTEYVVPDMELSRLAFNGYDIPVSDATIQNNGRTIQVIPKDNVQRTIFVNSTTYTLAEIHFHWDGSNCGGSEHIIDGIQYSMEAHFVHKSITKKIAVVAVFLQEQNNVVNKALKVITSNMARVTYKDQKFQLSSPLRLNYLLPANPSSFYRYLGSLTTPGCNEGVIWSLLINPVLVGVNQMTEFRKLNSAEKSDADSSCQLSGNHRPVQPLNNRTVFVSQ